MAGEILSGLCYGLSSIRFLDRKVRQWWKKKTQKKKPLGRDLVAGTGVDNEKITSGKLQQKHLTNRHWKCFTILSKIWIPYLKRLYALARTHHFQVLGYGSCVFSFYAILQLKPVLPRLVFFPVDVFCSKH